MSDTESPNDLSSSRAPAPSRDRLRFTESTPHRDVDRGGRTWEDRARQAERRLDEADRQAGHEVDRMRRNVDEVTRAPHTRSQIDQAKGVLRTAFGIESDAVIEALLRVSQQADVTLSTVAHWWVDNAVKVELD